MPPVVVRLTAKNLEQQLARTPWALVRLDRSPKPLLHRGLADSLDNSFPGKFTFGLLTRSELRPDALTAAFRTQLGPMRGGVNDGYYLFENALVVGHHGGETRPDNVRYASDAPIAEDAVLRDLARSSPREAEALRQLLAYLVPVIDRKHQAAGFRAEPMNDRPREPTPPPPPPRSPPPPRAPTPPPAPVASDPYAVLGITPAATDEELKEAWRTQLKLNHPDKVAHMSPALQKFAEQQTLAVMQAYEAIVLKRRR